MTTIAARRKRKSTPTLRNDAKEPDYNFPHHLNRQYESELKLMARALDRKLRAASRLALSQDHFDRLARQALKEVLEAFKPLDVALRFVDLFRSWLPIAWKSSAPANTLGRGAQAFQQSLIIRSMLDKQVKDFSTARLADAPKEALEKAQKRALNRAAFYARDQSGNMYHKAARTQAQHDGYVGYIWVRTTSASPRDEHLGRVGKFYRFGEVSDEPGVLPNCKCSMQPVRAIP